MRRLFAYLITALVALAVCVTASAASPKPAPAVVGNTAVNLPKVGIQCAHRGDVMPGNMSRHAVLVTLFHFEPNKMGSLVIDQNSPAFSLSYWVNGTRNHHTIPNAFAHPANCGLTWIDLGKNLPMTKNPAQMPELCVNLDRHFQGALNGTEPQLNRPDGRGSYAKPCPLPKLVKGVWEYEFIVVPAADMSNPTM